jgi:ribosome maturation factor RimP
LKDLEPMTAKLAPVDIVATSVAGLGYELVDFELSARGLMRVFIDKPDGIGVEDCASVSNHLSRVFLVEEIEFERLEVSSPGLDRPLKTLAHFQRHVGQAVKVRLSTLVEGRKRFDGVIEAVDGEIIVFGVVEDAVVVQEGKVHGSSHKSKRAGKAVKPVTLIRVPFESIDKTRLIPEL